MIGAASRAQEPADAAAARSPEAAGFWSVETISTYPSFLGIQADWNRLVSEAGFTHPFLTHEWVRTWWESFGTGSRLQVVTVRRDGMLVGIAPLIERQRRLYGLRVRCLELMSNEHTPRADLILAAERRAEACRAIWLHLSARRSGWDILRLAQLPDDSSNLAEMGCLAGRDGFLTGLWPSSQSPFLAVRGSWERYMKGLDAKYRSNLRNRMRRLEAHGAVSIETVEGGERLNGAMEEALRLEAAGWKGRAGSAIASCEQTRLFYTTLARRAARSGWLRLQFLVAGDRRIAVHLSLLFGDRQFLLKPGYDPEYSGCSPGSLLCLLALQEAHARGSVEFDFLGEADEWKLQWTRQVRPHSWLFVFSDRLRGRLIHSVKFRVAPLVGRWRCALGAGRQHRRSK